MTVKTTDTVVVVPVVTNTPKIPAAEIWVAFRVGKNFNDCTAASTSLRRMGWSSSVSIWGQFSTDGSPLAL